MGTQTKPTGKHLFTTVLKVSLPQSEKENELEYVSTLKGESKNCPGVTFYLHKPSYGGVLEFDRQTADYREQVRGLQSSWEELKEELDALRKEWDAKQLDRKKGLTAGLDTAEGEEYRAGIQDKIRRIDNGYEYERLIGLLPYVADDEQRKEVHEKIDALGNDHDKFDLPRELSRRFREVREKADNLTAGIYNPARLRWGLDRVEGLKIDGKNATIETLVAKGPPDLVTEIVAAIDKVASMSADELKNCVLLGTSVAVEPSSESTTTASAA